MAKNIIQDVVFEKKSIRNIPIGRNRVSERVRKYDEEDLIPKVSEKKPKKTQKNRGKGFFKSFSMWVLVILVVFVVVISVLSYFGSATVILSPRTETASIDSTLKAVKEDSLGGLTFQTMSFSREGSEFVESTGVSHVERKASGMITIKNSYSSLSQKLIDKTRFESPTGLTYRISGPVTVPGKSTTGEPGSISVMVYADNVGEKYNISTSSIELTIPGFKGDPRYSAIKAYVKDTISGGFSGNEKVASKDSVEAARIIIKNRLTEQMNADAINQIPEGFVLLNNSSVVEFSDLQSKDVESGIEVREKAVYKGIILDKVSFEKEIAKNALGSTYDGSPVYIKNLDKLSTEVLDKKAVSNGSISSVSFKVKGEVMVVWNIDSEKIKKDLAGIGRKDYQSILSRYQNSIKKADARMFPVWLLSFPENVSKIRVEVEN